MHALAIFFFICTCSMLRLFRFISFVRRYDVIYKFNWSLGHGLLT